MEKKVFWITFTVLGLLADFLLPIWWGLAATVPIVFASWWVAYRSDWFKAQKTSGLDNSRLGHAEPAAGGIATAATFQRPVPCDRGAGERIRNIRPAPALTRCPGHIAAEGKGVAARHHGIGDKPG